MAQKLTADEQISLDRLEATVLVGIGSVVTMIEAGKALAEIRRRQLYRVCRAILADVHRDLHADL